MITKHQFLELANNASLNTLAKEANGDYYNDTEEFKIEDFTYKNYVVKQLMFKHLSNTNFEGITVNDMKSIQSLTFVLTF